jgi:hypothetical protein
MLLEKPAEDMLRDVLALLSHVRLHANVEMRVVEILCTRDLIEKIGEPEEVVLVANHPVEVDAPMISVWRSRCCHRAIREVPRLFSRFASLKLVVLKICKYPRKGRNTNSSSVICQFRQARCMNSSRTRIPYCIGSRRSVALAHQTAHPVRS